MIPDTVVSKSCAVIQQGPAAWISHSRSPPAKLEQLFAGTPANFGMWRSLVARVVRDDEVAGSNPVIPTNDPLVITIRDGKGIFHIWMPQ